MGTFTVQEVIADLKKTVDTMNTVTAQQIEAGRKERDYKRIAGYAGYAVTPDYDLGSWLSLDADVDAEGEGESWDDIAKRENDILDRQGRM